MAFFLFPGGEKQGPCGPCAGDSKAIALPGVAGPRDVAESHFAIAPRWPRAPWAHVQPPLCRLRRRADGARRAAPKHKASRPQA